MKHLITYAIGCASGCVATLLVIGICALFYMKFHRFDGLVPGVTTHKIRSVEIGMTEGQVRKILGHPVSAGRIPSAFDPKTGLHSNFSDLGYVYAKDLSSLWYPKLWIYFEDGKVSSVYAKNYVFDDVGVYGRNINYCEVNDPRRSSVGCSWEQPEFINAFPNE